MVIKGRNKLGRLIITTLNISAPQIDNTKGYYYNFFIYYVR